MTGNLDGEIARVASRQHNVFARRQALAMGFTSSTINRRLSAGRWTHEAPSVYGMAGGVRTWQRRLMTAHLDLGPHSVLSHRSAAALHRFPGFGQGTPELTVPAGAGRSPRWRVHEGDIPPADRVRVEQLAATSVVRTVLDLSGGLGRAALLRLVEALLTEGRVELGPLTARAEAHRRPGRRGSAALAALLAELGPGHIPSASDLEAKLFAVLRAAGLPDPVRQHPLPSRGAEGRVDAAYPHVRLLIEADSRRWHARFDDFARDHHRDIEAALLGWRTIRFTWADLVERPRWVRQVVAGFLQVAA
jgi:very-short-patch-repair endonuclease